MSDHAPNRISSVGSSVRRVDAIEKSTGKARFVGDLSIPGMLHGRVLRSPVPSGRITNIDVSDAERLPGVRAILTARDVADIDPFYGHAIKDRPLIALDRVRFTGEPVAAVAADSEAAADEAIRAISVEYEEYPVVATLDAALAVGAPLVHEGFRRPGLFHGLGNLQQTGNICSHSGFSRGQTNTAFANAHFLEEGEYVFPAVYQYAMETHTVVALWGADGLTIWACCQHPYLVQAELADLFRLPLSSVRIIVPYIGGGFGSKSYTKMEPLVAALARKAAQPVRVCNRVEDSMVTTRRHNMKCWMRTSATKDGELLGRECRIWLDTGAYADNGPRVAAMAVDAAPGPYNWRAVAIDAWAIYTNTPPAGSYRGFGGAHLFWIGESQIDTLARKAGLDPLTFRLRNMLRRGDEVRPNRKPLDADLAGDVAKVAQCVGWGKPKSPLIGRGLSVGLLAAGANPVSTAVVRLQADGTAIILTSTTELGQGSRTVFTQIVADELALPLNRILVVGPDTLFTPYDRSTGASRSTTLSGKAVQAAAVDVQEQLLRIGSYLWGLPRTAVSLRNGAIWHEKESLSYTDLIRNHFGMAGGELIGRGEVRPEQGPGSFPEGPVFWEVCVGGAEVSLDAETGVILVRRMSCIADVGKAINPKLVEAQDEGGSLQGFGNALFEEMIFEDGQLLNGTLLEYRVPITTDLPDEFHSILVENADGPGPYGAKGVGESSLAAIPGAIVNALADLGVDARELPLTPERVWRRIREVRAERAVM